jgi:hypothetical protein
MFQRLVRAFAAALACLGGAAAAQTDVTDPGPFRHVGTGTVFPEAVAGFQRVRIVRYEDPSGEDVGVSYRLTGPDGPVIVTEYVYPVAAQKGAARKAICRDEFDGSGAAIKNAVKLGEPAARSRPGVPASLALRSEYDLTVDIGGKPTVLASELSLYCYVKGPWFVKYRITRPKTPAGSQAAERFMQVSPFPR